jgi:hypothetical protein
MLCCQLAKDGSFKVKPLIEVERDTNPPAASNTFGTNAPEGCNRHPPVKAPEGHDEPLGGEPPEDSPFHGLDPYQKLNKALRMAKPISREQRLAQEAERSVRSAKLAAVQAKGGSIRQQKGVLKGALPRKNFESLEQHFTPEDVKDA